MTLNIVFAGTPKFGLPCLEALNQSKHSIKAVYTQPDRPSGRGRKIQPCAIKEWALKQHLPVYQPLNFKSPEAIEQLRELKPDLLIVIAYGLILPQSVLQIPPFGCINVHASLLPRWRGASPIQQAILKGDTETGITLMQMDTGMDTGPILDSVTCPVYNTDTAEHLHDRLAAMAVHPLLTLLDKLLTGEVRTQPQENTLATYASKINKEDACIDWNNSALEIDRQIRAFNPWPIAYTHLNDQTLRIHQAEVLETYTSAVPGTILSMDKTGMLIATGHQCLLVHKIQMPGGTVISIGDYLNSGKNQLHSGHVLQ